MLGRIEQIDAALCAEGLSAQQTRQLTDERAALQRGLMDFSEFSITPRPPSRPIQAPVSDSLETARVEVNLANDFGQHVRFTGGDTLTLSGRATGGGIIPSMICLTVAGTRIRLAVTAGDSALQTAQKLAAVLPPGFSAQLTGRDPVVFKISAQR